MERTNLRPACSVVLARVAGLLAVLLSVRLVAIGLLAGVSLAQGSFEELAREARTGKSYARAKAVRSLAELDTLEAWEVLVELLGDPAGEAGGSAQWYLGTCREAEIAAALLAKPGLKSRDERARWRAAEALGRMPLTLDVDPLWKVAAKDKSERVRRFAWRALGQRADRGEDVLGDSKLRAKRAKSLLTAATKDKVVTVRGRALLASAIMLGEEAREAVAKAIKEKDPELRAAAVRAASRLENSDEWLLTVSDDPHWSVRRQVLEVWSEAPTRDVVSRLAERLDGEAQGRLRARIVACLRELSGLKHRDVSAAWKAWAESLDDDWRPGDRAERVEPLEVSSAWNGMPILSDRIAFLIDLSGSIREKRGDGKTRKEVVDEELAAALGSLTPDTQFVLLGYHREVLIWEDELKSASPANVKAALKWFQDIDSSGPGNLWSAIEAAWELSDEIDTLFVLHDGAPTGGEHYRAELYRELFLARGLTRPTFFDTLLVDSSRFVRGIFTELAHRTGGLAEARDLNGNESK